MHLHPKLLPRNRDREGFWISEEPSEWTGGFLLGHDGGNDRYSQRFCEGIPELNALDFKFVIDVVFGISREIARIDPLDQFVRRFQPLC